MKILIPVDGSECANSTLDWATETLDRQKTEYVVLYVIPHTTLELTVEEYQVEDALKIIQEAERYLKGKGCQVVKAEYMEGDPVQAICDYADEIGADQILMGSHGRSGLVKLLLGSVSSGVMEKSRKPVFVYKNVACLGAKASR